MWMCDKCNSTDISIFTDAQVRLNQCADGSMETEVVECNYSYTEWKCNKCGNDSVHNPALED